MKKIIRMIGSIISTITTIVMVIPMYIWFEIRCGMISAGYLSTKFATIIYSKKRKSKPRKKHIK